jgi:2-polyprenyl-3-methyl-5-hydroxy-6-metoxy-1,4-benzoquinol methylase
MEVETCDVCQTRENKTVYAIKYNIYGKRFKIKRCENCNLVFYSPRLNKQELESFYDDTYYKSITDDEKRINEEIEKYSERYNIIERYVKTGRVLSIGCGLGFDLEVASKRGWDTNGVEISDFAPEYAKNRSGITVMNERLELLELPESHFDLITFWDSLEHMENPVGVLGKTKPWLKKEGLLVLRMPNIDGLFPRIGRRLASIIGEWRHPEPPLHLYEFGNRSITYLLQRSGFRVVDILSDDAPIDYLVRGSIHPIRIKILASLIYPIARLMKSGNAMIVIARRT